MHHTSDRAASRGRLVLMPNTLDLGTGHETPLADTLPAGAVRRAAALNHWLVENAKSARAFLKRVNAVVPLSQPLQALDIRELPRAPKGQPGAAVSASQWQALLQPALQGQDIGLLSEAGLPAIADPGSELVAQAHALGINVEPWSGPSSLLMALAASGLGGQHFAFVGYLPVEADERARRIRELDQVSRRLKQTQLAIETPYRNDALLGALLAHLQANTRLSVACGLTLPGGWCRTATVEQWRKQAPPFAGQEGSDGRMPAVFAWLG